MTWFTRPKRSRFPGDMMQRLELFGRYELGRHTSGIDSSLMWPECIQPFFDDAQADPAGFSADLETLIAGEHGGFVTFGASRLIWEIFSDGYLAEPASVRIMDAGIDFKLARGLTRIHLTGFEMDRLARRRSEQSEL